MHFANFAFTIIIIIQIHPLILLHLHWFIDRVILSFELFILFLLYLVNNQCTTHISHKIRTVYKGWKEKTYLNCKIQLGILITETDYQEVCRQLGEKDHLLTECQRKADRDVEAAHMEVARLMASHEQEKERMELDLMKVRCGFMCCF